MTPTETVNAFFAALRACDVEAAAELLAIDVEYQNVPFAPVHGTVATKRLLRLFLLPFRGFEIEVLNIAEADGVVLTERIDTFVNGPYRGGFWVCGTFVVVDGRIEVWRDRFDITSVLVGLAGGLLMMPLRMFRRR